MVGSSHEAQLAAADADQVRMMEEMVIMTDYYDNPIGEGSKKETHVWTNIEAGMLHRAFSVFLFTPDGKLILQQRASTKITFPLIWANTCCSHPLNVPGETQMDHAAGVKNAARRKLEQELGIPPEDVPFDCFTWITRVHYVGASLDGVAEGAAPLWGEHEIDWILMCTPETMPRMKGNPNEVEATKAFTQTELRAWMATRHARGEEVSPWFGVMEASGLLYRWWDAVLARRLDTVLQRDVIHREHDLRALAEGKEAGSVPMPLAFKSCLAATTKGGVKGPLKPITCEAVHPNWSAAAGQKPKKASLASSGASARSSAAAADSAAPASSPRALLPGASAATPKQGAYGKVKIHKEGILTQLCHLDEVFTALRYKAGMLSELKTGPLPASVGPDALWCEDMLCKTSRSFALVIQQLPVELRLSIGIFYLVLRGLDTVEDDMTAFEGRQAEKLAHLRAFHTYLKNPSWRMDGVGEGDEAALLQGFGYVCRTWQSLPALDREVIADITARMGDGMARFAGRDLRGGTENRQEYNLYCHYVAGLVGEGLTRLFVSGGYEDASIVADLRLADDMGLFLQKANIIRDYLEDLVDGRAFYPADIWGLYAPTLAALRDMAAPTSPVEQQDAALACLNHMVADALTLAPSCLRYMAGLHHPDVFRFCAIPQLMAIATLDKVANNIDVFTGVVKLRRGKSLQLMIQAGRQGMPGVYAAFLTHARSILASIPRHHKAAYETAETAVRAVEAICLENLPHGSALLASSPFASPQVVLAVAALTAFLLRHLYQRSGEWGVAASTGDARFLPRITDSWDVLALTALVGCVAYLFSFAAVPVVLSLAPTGTTPPSSPSHHSGAGKGAKRAAGEEESEAGPLPVSADAVVGASPSKARSRRPAKV